MSTDPSDAFLINMQSLGQQLDHLAMAHLDPEATKRYLFTKNKHDVEFLRTYSNLYSLKTGTRNKSRLVKNSADQITSNHVSSPPESKEMSDAETQVFSRKPKNPDAVAEKIQILNNELDINPSSIDIWLQRGRLWQEQKDYAASLSDFLRAWKLDKDFESTHQALHNLDQECTQQGIDILARIRSIVQR